MTCHRIVNRRSLSLIVMVQVFLAGALLWSGCAKLSFATRLGDPPAGLKSPVGDVAIFSTPGWRAFGQLTLRLEEGPEKGLLLKHSQSEVIYRYDPISTRLSRVPTEQWKQTKTTAAEHLAEIWWPEGFRIDNGSGQLLVGVQRVLTMGEFAVIMRQSPNSEWSAVLSADGPRKTSLPIPGSSLEFWGQHYHQLLSVPDAIFVGDPVRIPLRSADGSLTLTWSADGHYVVYADLSYSHLCIVHTDISGD